MNRKGIKETELEKIIEVNKNDLRKTIFEFGINGKETICTETLNLFIEILATEISNAAVRILPYSGIYVVGIIKKKFRCVI